MEATEIDTIHGHTTAYRSPNGTTTMREWEHDHDRGEIPHTHELDGQTIMRELTTLPAKAEKETEDIEDAPAEAGEYTRRVWHGDK